MVRDQVSTEGVEKLLPVALQVPLGQEHSYVQGRCCVATANLPTPKLRTNLNALTTKDLLVESFVCS